MEWSRFSCSMILCRCLEDSKISSRIRERQVTSALSCSTVTIKPSEKRIMGNPGCVVTENFWPILSDWEVVELGETGRPSAENTFPSSPVLLHKSEYTDIRSGFNYKSWIISFNLDHLLSNHVSVWSSCRCVSFNDVFCLAPFVAKSNSSLDMQQYKHTYAVLNEMLNSFPSKQE